MKITKTLLALCLAIVICFTNTPIYTSAEQTIESSNPTPRWSHLSHVTFSFSATESGGHASVDYTGYDDSFVQANVHIKLQKKFLLVFWTDVDEWSTSSTEVDNLIYHLFELEGTGTYKATLTFEAIGTDGTVDTLTDTIESKYSN